MPLLFSLFPGRAVASEREVLGSSEKPLKKLVWNFLSEGQARDSKTLSGSPRARIRSREPQGMCGFLRDKNWHWLPLSISALADPQEVERTLSSWARSRLCEENREWGGFLSALHSALCGPHS